MIGEQLQAHLDSGATTLCRAWAITRNDGVTLGFTDHDLPLFFEGITFSASAGLSTSHTVQGTGLAVDNAEAAGALSDAGVTAADIEAGRYDGAELRAWLVNWAVPEQRVMQFRGRLGELRRSGGAFTAELRGLTEALNRPLGRIYQKPCTAVLGDAACGVELSAPGYAAEAVLVAVAQARVLHLPPLSGFSPGWFNRGVLTILDGAAQGLRAMVKRDRIRDADGAREITLWAPLGAVPAPGDRVGVQAGCDKRFDTCRFKFGNAANYQGFPDIPGTDWLTAVPATIGETGGGSRR
ncbi:DUF2163 domain-containing protein [Sediminimonas sp.]|uniref:DUF2163 domain-containing protein n=1 Tax=Sediminimonas sp. TaxID=2823379 RepID=UPI0025ECBCA6|nr:DUF2163 domain-containing protein [Sediminimonas sp.]